jgi:actin-related protein 8
MFANGTIPLPHISAHSIAIKRDAVLSVAPLDIAIITSIQNAAKGDEKNRRVMLGSTMVIGAGAITTQLAPFLEIKLKALRPEGRKEGRNPEGWAPISVAEALGA